MKILFIDYYFPPHPGGSEVAIDELTQAVKKLGHEVFVITKDHPDEPAYRKRKGIHVYRIKCPSFPYTPKAYFLFASISKTAKIIKKHKIEAVISQDIFSSMAGTKAKKQFNLPHIYIHEFVAEDIPTIMNRLKVSMQKFLLPRIKCDIFLSWSKFMKSKYFDKWGINQKIGILPNGANTIKFNPKIDGIPVRKKYGVKNNEILLVTAKPFYPINAKGIEYVIKTLPIILKEHKNVKYMLVGDGAEKENLENLAKSLGLENHVIFAGSKTHNQVPKYLAAANIIVHSFAHEATTSVALMESMSMGKAHLVTNTGEIRNILTKETAMLVKDKSPPSIANGAIKLIRNPKLRKKLGNNIRKLAEDKYSINRIAKELMGYFKQN